ncbi:hypothetical protein [Novosphingobium sp. FKTRR1]|uniref:hypothetical protein n=1 Tax=Novosphingobium sp. FKTRR1 TaxID=2879118 RepID=UPI001CF084B0|nr:hypothetical protein [Novosphingobium sp. FKTRR1]
MSAGVLNAFQMVGAVGGPIVGGIEQSGTLRAQAAADRANADRTQYQGELDSWQTARDARLAQGAGIALSAAEGNVGGTGTVADLIEQAALEREMEIVNIRAKAAGEAANLRTRAASESRAAGFALVKGVLGGAMGYAATKSDQRNTASILNGQKVGRR